MAVVRGRARARVRLQLVPPHGELGDDLVGEAERDARLGQVRLQAPSHTVAGPITCGYRLHHIRLQVGGGLRLVREPAEKGARLSLCARRATDYYSVVSLPASCRR